jgi:hypothetical protein
LDNFTNIFCASWMTKFQTHTTASKLVQSSKIVL